MIVEFNVSGMHCNSCVSLIKMDLEELKGISNVSGDFKKGLIKVEFNEKILEASAIAKKIGETGYNVKAAK